MSKEIKNPYVASYSRISGEWNVIFRYMIVDRLKFKYICSASDEPTASKIAKLLNKDLKND